MRNSKIGGQAVMEGIMMKNGQNCAIAVRKPNHEIEVKKETRTSLRDRYKVADKPVIRGMVTFVESFVTGMQMLNYSSSFFEEEDEKGKSEEEKKKDEKAEGILTGIIMIISILFAVGLFVLMPFFVSESLRRVIRSAQLRGLLEGVIRVVLFVLYVKIISYMEEIRRVFMYHGAEHKTINCIENGLELTVENVRKQSMAHKRCGTSFTLVVMLISILFFMFIVVGNVWLRMVFRILLIPIIAGISYEFIQFAGEHDSPVANALSKPGLWLQSLTTREPDDDMIEVAIASVEAVFDWKSFILPRPTQKAVSKKPAQATAKAVSKKTAQETAAAVEDMEILSLDDAAEEEDEILKALDRYFEAPAKEETSHE